MVIIAMKLDAVGIAECRPSSDKKAVSSGPALVAPYTPFSAGKLRNFTVITKKSRSKFSTIYRNDPKFWGI